MTLGTIMCQSLHKACKIRFVNFQKVEQQPSVSQVYQGMDSGRNCPACLVCHWVER